MVYKIAFELKSLMESTAEACSKDGHHYENIQEMFSFQISTCKFKYLGFTRLAYFLLNIFSFGIRT